MYSADSFNIFWLLGAMATSALALRPWRLLQQGRLHTPLLLCSLALPLVWALPFIPGFTRMPHWSAACLVLLMLGWPLALGVFLLSAALLSAGGFMPLQQALETAFWQGALPATLALIPGWLIRQAGQTHIFLYTIGRAFLGSVLSLFAAFYWAHTQGFVLLPMLYGGSSENAAVAPIGLWLLAWGDAFITGMLVAILVAFKPAWVATWSDALYLHNHHKPS